MSIGMLALASLGFGQDTLYRSVYTLKDLHIKLRPWGSGTISETDETAFEGGHSVRVTSRNFFQGGILSLDKAVDLSGEADSKSLFRIAIRTPQNRVISPQGLQNPNGGFPGGRGAGGGPGGGFGGGGGVGGGGDAGGDGGAFSAPGSIGSGFAFAQPSYLGQVGVQLPPSGPPGNFPGGQFPGQGFPGQGFPGQGFPGGFPGQAQQAQPGAAIPPMQSLRIIITTTDGKKSECYLPVSQSRADKSGWKLIGIPLQAISGFDKTNKNVKEVAFAADTLATFYIGGIGMVQDATPIEGDIYSRIRGVQEKFAAIQFANVALNDTVEFRASGSGGSSILSYEWDFDASDGIQTDAVGQVVKCTFHKPGTFTITLTVKDKYGFKKPASKTAVITVNP